MAEAAQIVIDHCRPEMIDLNFGCPTHGKNGDGAALREPELLEEIVSAVVKASSVPVTAKIRWSWDQDPSTAWKSLSEQRGREPSDYDPRAHETSSMLDKLIGLD